MDVVLNVKKYIQTPLITFLLLDLANDCGMDIDLTTSLRTLRLRPLLLLLKDDDWNLRYLGLHGIHKHFKNPSLSVYFSVCALIMDLHSGVRIKTLQTLADLKIDDLCLLQTLNKKLLPDLASRNTIDLMQDEFTLTDYNCGAFIHGLEDEISTVRISCLDSISSVAHSSADFKRAAIPIILDMLNDEMANVRTHALVTLQNMAKSANGLLVVDELIDNVLVSIQEATIQIRKEGYALISQSRFSKTGLNKIIDALKHNYVEKHQDAPFILQASYDLGKHHTEAIKSSINHYFGLDYRFLAVERKYEDNIIYLILLLGANIQSDIPKYIQSQIQKCRSEYSYIDTIHDSDVVMNT
jgi:hypothetical protein